MSKVLEQFEDFQKARVTFVQTIAELATRPQNIEGLIQKKVIKQLYPLLEDNVPSIQQSAQIALARMLSQSHDLSRKVLVKKRKLLEQMVASLGETNRFYRKTSAYVLRSIAKHCPILAEEVCKLHIVQKDSRFTALDGLVECLNDSDSTVKEMATWAISYIAKHSSELAFAVERTTKSITYLIKCMEEPEVNLKRVAVSCLTEIAKHDRDLALSIVEKESVTILSSFLSKNNNLFLRRAACACLAQISKHGVDLAERVTTDGTFEKLMANIKDNDIYVKRNSMTCLLQIMKSEDSVKLMRTYGPAPIVDYIAETRGANRISGIMVLYYMAGYDESLALQITSMQSASGITGIDVFRDILAKEQFEFAKTAVIQTIEVIASIDPEHTKALTDADMHSHLLAVHSISESEDLQKTAEMALEGIVGKCEELSVLESLLQIAPHTILEAILIQISALLLHNNEKKKQFVESGGLKKVQSFLYAKDEPTKEFVEYHLRDRIREITDHYDKELVDYFTPGFKEKLPSKLKDEE